MFDKAKILKQWEDQESCPDFKPVLDELLNYTVGVRNSLIEAERLLKEGCDLYDKHIPEGTSSFRSDADWLLNTINQNKYTKISD